MSLILISISFATGVGSSITRPPNEGARICSPRNETCNDFTMPIITRRASSLAKRAPPRFQFVIFCFDSLSLFFFWCQEIPSTGVECWYKLGGRSQRSTIQGRIHLKLWLSTREDLGTSEEDNWTEIKQQEKLHCVFIDFEVSRFKVNL